MLEQRALINSTIDRYMVSQDYTRNEKTENPPSLDTWVYDYVGVSGNKDNIKIEINYSLRAHIFAAEERLILTEHFQVNIELIPFLLLKSMEVKLTHC